MKASGRGSLHCTEAAAAMSKLTAERQMPLLLLLPLQRQQQQQRLLTGSLLLQPKWMYTLDATAAATQ